MNEVYNIDCMEYMRTLPDKAFDLAIVDPPYGIKESGDKNHTRGKKAVAKDYPAFYGGDKDAPDKSFFNELFRVSKNQIIWGANHFISRFCKDASCWVVWDKENGESDFADCELAWTSFKCAVRKYTFRWAGMLQGNMKDKEERIHPTQKPVALYKWLLSKFGEGGGTVLDTHVGSGSIRIACDEMGYDFIGCEIDKFYWEAQEKRYAEWKKGAGSQLQFEF